MKAESKEDKDESGLKREESDGAIPPSSFRLHPSNSRRWEIRITGFPTDHSPEESLDDAVEASRKRFGIPSDVDLRGQVIEWEDGKPIGPAKPLHVELASLAELKRAKTAVDDSAEREEV